MISALAICVLYFRLVTLQISLLILIILARGVDLVASDLTSTVYGPSGVQGKQRQKMDITLNLLTNVTSSSILAVPGNVSHGTLTSTLTLEFCFDS